MDFMGNKKGQITVFILLGILLMIAGWYAWHSYEKRIGQPFDLAMLPPDTADAKAQVRYCMEKTGMQGVYLLGSQGGYITPQLDALQTELATIAIPINHEQVTFPS